MKTEDLNVGDEVLVKMRVEQIVNGDSWQIALVGCDGMDGGWIDSGDAVLADDKYRRAIIAYSMAVDKIDAADDDEDLVDDAAEEVQAASIYLKDLGEELIGKGNS